MPALRHLWLGTVTLGGSAGTDSRIVLIVNAGGDRLDTVHHTIGATPQDDLEANQANVYEIAQSQFHTILDEIPPTLDSEMLNPSSIRIGIRGGDAWRPKTVFLWGREHRDSGDVIPLALAIDLETAPFFGALNRVTLSTDAREGQTSFAVPPTLLGGLGLTINSLLLLIVTADKRGAGTDSRLDLEMRTNDNDVVFSGVLDLTAQRDQERGQANLYFLPVRTPFRRRELIAAGGFVRLGILGPDPWLPASIFLFGLDVALPANFSPGVEPLIHIPTWEEGPFGSNAEAGVQARFLNVYKPSSEP